MQNLSPTFLKMRTTSKTTSYITNVTIDPLYIHIPYTFFPARTIFIFVRVDKLTLIKYSQYISYNADRIYRNNSIFAAAAFIILLFLHDGAMYSSAISNVSGALCWKGKNMAAFLYLAFGLVRFLAIAFIVAYLMGPEGFTSPKNIESSTH